jgi:hypothetical protein
MENKEDEYKYRDLFAKFPFERNLEAKLQVLYLLFFSKSMKRM